MASIIKRKDSYFIMVSCGYDLDGKQLRKNMTFTPPVGMTPKQIEKAVNEEATLFERKVKLGQVLDSNVSFFEFSQRWLSDYAELHLAPKTLSRYKDLLKRIIPAIGHIKLEKLQPHHLLEFYNKLTGDGSKNPNTYIAGESFLEAFKASGFSKASLEQQSGVSKPTVSKCFTGKPVAQESAIKVCQVLEIDIKKAFKLNSGKKPLSNKTISHHHRLISAILTTAVQWQVIFDNPAKRLKAPKVERKEAKFLDEKQTEKLLKLLQAENVQHRAMVILLIYSGVRRGELCGLEWKDIDFENRMIKVSRTSQYISGHGIFEKGTKNYSSERTIKLSSQVFIILEEFRKWQIAEKLRLGDRWVNSDRLFITAEGAPIHPDSVSGWFRNFIKKHGFPEISIHSLRHTNITLMLAAGVPLRTVSQRAGHAQMSTTSNIYAHAIQSADEKAATVLDYLFVMKC